MTHDPAPRLKADAELRRLVDQMLGGTITAPDLARLEERLARDPAAMEYYLEISSVDSLLPAALGALEGGLPFHGKPSRPWWHWTAAAAAAVVLIAASIAVFRPTGGHLIAHKSRKTGPQFAATITGSVGARRTDPGAPQVAVGQTLQTETISLSTGLLEITHASGARVLLQGPAKYTILQKNHGKLEFGKLVASVPPQAVGFTVDYANDHVIDHGTEFAVSLPSPNAAAEVGVFRGEVEVRQDSGRLLGRLYTDHALRHEPGAESETIPFSQDRFIRNLPSREFEWKHPNLPVGDKHVMTFDVSALIWHAGGYRPLFKWIHGFDALDIYEVILKRNDKEIAADRHLGSAGDPANVRNNIYQLNVADNQYRPGRWTLEVLCSGRPRTYQPNRPTDSRGVMIFNDDLAFSATSADFLGTWEYWHNGHYFTRTFRSDGTATLMDNGVLDPFVERATWTCENGVLELKIPTVRTPELHMLRDSGTLCFVNMPYHDARKVQPDGGVGTSGMTASAR